MKCVLSIAGSDSSGGAGIQADIKTILSGGAYAMTAITALTAQNTTGVRDVLEATPAFLGEQLDAVFEDIVPDAVKIGMVSSRALIGVIAEKLKHYRAENIVVDPVMVATSGSSLIRSEAVVALAEQLFPLAAVITPNLPEAEVLWGKAITSKAEMVAAAETLSKTYGCAVLIKGGHADGHADDLLWQAGAARWFSGEHIPTENTHGTGCTLSSAIATGLAKGLSLEKAVEAAKAYVTGALKAGLTVGKLGHGCGPLPHHYALSGFFTGEGETS